MTSLCLTSRRAIQLSKVFFLHIADARGVSNCRQMASLYFVVCSIMIDQQKAAGYLQCHLRLSAADNKLVSSVASTSCRRRYCVEADMSKRRRGISVDASTNATTICGGHMISEDEMAEQRWSQTGHLYYQLGQSFTFFNGFPTICLPFPGAQKSNKGSCCNSSALGMDISGA